MKRKYSFIFLSFGLLLFVLFGLFNYTNLFDKLDSHKDNNIVNNIINYDFIKSYDVNKKMKVIFPIYDNLIIDFTNRTDFYKSYFNDDGFSIYAMIYLDEDSVEKKEKSLYSNFKNSYETKGYKVNQSEIKCQYMCKRYQAYNKDNSIFVDKLKIFLVSSSNEVFELSYSLYGESLSNESVNTIINNIKVSNDATYTIGKVSNGELNIDLQVNDKKFVNIILNSNLYSETINKFNSFNATTIINKENSAILNLSIKHKDDSITLKNDVVQYYRIDEKNAIIKEVNVGNKVFSEFDLNDKKIYVYPIDNSSMLLIESKDKKIDINDFKNITIKDV